MDEGTPPLAAEVQALRPSARRKRALEAGATEEEIEEVCDADDVVAAYVALLLKYECEQAVSVSQGHQGTGSVMSAFRSSGVTSLFNGRHAMLSYQWDVQSEVLSAYDRLMAKGVPCWMGTQVPDRSL